MIKFFTYLLLSFIFIQNGFTQTIKRLSERKFELSSKPINAHIKPNVFTDFGWLEPNVKGKKIPFINGSYFFMLNGSAFQLQRFETTMMQLQGRGTSSLLSVEVSDKNIYYDKSSLKKIAIKRERWTLPQPGQWQWAAVTDSTLDIPAYSYYEFAIHDNMTIIVYEIKNASGETEFYLQNASYLSATNEDGVNYILLDIDCNGIFTDTSDQILFNSWNPNLKQSSYHKIKGLKENTWYDMDFLRDEYFLTFAYTSGKLSLIYENDAYNNTTKTGTITFSNLPKQATIQIDGKEYLSEKKSVTFTCEFGVHKAIIARKGILDQEITFMVNDNNLKQEIPYVKAQPAGELVIRNIFSKNYFITIANQNGYSKTYYNTDAFNVPIGKNNVSIDIDGYSATFSFSISKKGIVSFDLKEILNTQ